MKILENGIERLSRKVSSFCVEENLVRELICVCERTNSAYKCFWCYSRCIFWDLSTKHTRRFYWTVKKIIWFVLSARIWSCFYIFAYSIIGFYFGNMIFFHLIILACPKLLKRAEARTVAKFQMVWDLIR